jgi:hypothetical protein
MLTNFCGKYEGNRQLDGPRQTLEHSIVTHMTIARQRFGKHISEVTLSKVKENPLLASNNTRTVRSGDLYSVCPEVSNFRQ